MGCACPRTWSNICIATSFPYFLRVLSSCKRPATSCAHCADEHFSTTENCRELVDHFDGKLRWGWLPSDPQAQQRSLSVTNQKEHMEMTLASDPGPHGHSSKDLSQDRYGHCRQRADEACCGKETWVLEALGDKQKANGRDAYAMMRLPKMQGGHWFSVNQRE